MKAIPKHLVAYEEEWKARMATLVSEVIRDMPSASVDQQLAEAMKRNKGSMSPTMLRERFEAARTTSARSDAVQVRARDMLNEQRDGLGYIIPKPEK